MNGYSSPETAPPWWQRITGRRALSWQVVVFGTLLTYPQIVLTGGTLGSRTVQPDEFPTIATVTAGAVVVAVSFAGLAQLTFMRNRAITSIPLWLYFSFYMTAGFIYAAGMEISDAILGVDAIVPWPIRFLFAGITTVGWGVIVSLILEAQDRFRTTREELLAKSVELEVASLRDSVAAQQIRARVDEQVKTDLTHGRERLQSILGERAAKAVLGTNSRSDLEIATILRDTAQGSVRDLSHRLYEEAESEYPRPKVAGILRQFISQPRFLPLATALLIGLGLPGASIRAVGPTLAPLAVLGMSAVIFTILFLANRAISAAPRLRHVIYVLSLIVVNGIILAFALLPADVPAAGAEAASIIIGVSTALIAASLVAAIGRVRARVLESLRGDVAQQHITAAAYHQELAYALTETARALHGSVQTRLIVCAGAIESASRDSDQEAIDAAISEALDALDHDRQISQYSGNVEADLADVTALWSPMCEITMHLDDQVAALDDRPDIPAIVEEALANSYRHGHAEHIDVMVARSEDGVTVIVTDDGCGLTDGEPGLGMALIARLTRGNFSLNNRDGGTQLIAHLP